MSSRFLYLGVFACSIACVVSRAIGAPAEDDDIPVVGRPAGLPFSGASGAFEVEAKAEPTSLRAEQPITFTVTVRAVGTVRHPPRRPDLGKLPEFANHFYIENVDTGNPSADGRNWEFVYRLKPRSADVTAVPSVPFVYYNPLIRPASRGFQLNYTDPIPLKLQAAEEYVPLPPLSDGVYELASGPGLEAHDPLPGPPGIALLVLLIAAPPLVCIGYYVAWRIRHPDAGRLVRRRRSRAAKQSLRLLRAARRMPMPQRAAHTADALTRYLHERFELAAAEPTPAEAAAALQRGGCAAALADATARFMARCDAARFAPTADGATLDGAAVRLILDVEAETWASRHS
jgi:hypothetical protein